MPNVTMHSKVDMQIMNSSHLISLITTPKSPLSSTPFRHRPTTKLRRLLPPRAIAAPPRPRINQITPKTPTDKAEIFKELESWAVDFIIPLLKPVDTIWQPNDYLPDPSQTSDDFTDEVRALRERTAELPDDYFVALVGDMITEEAVPTYMNMVNTFTEVRDQTGASPCPWAVWTRAWTAEENRHGDLLRTYLYLSGRVDMTKIERTIQYLIGAGMDGGMENSAYLGFVYTSFQERATFVSHGNTARLAKDGGDPVLAKICGTIASDEKRHENAYSRIVDKLLDVDTSDAMVAIADMMKKKITMPAHLMYDGEDPCIYEHFSAVAQRLGVYTTGDYADIVEVLVDRWKLEKREGMNGEGRRAQDYVCGLAPRFRKLQERADERARKLEPRSVKFSWIFNKEVRVTP